MRRAFPRRRVPVSRRTAPSRRPRWRLPRPRRVRWISGASLRWRALGCGCSRSSFSRRGFGGSDLARDVRDQRRTASPCRRPRLPRRSCPTQTPPHPLRDLTCVRCNVARSMRRARAIRRPVNMRCWNGRAPHARISNIWAHCATHCPIPRNVMRWMRCNACGGGAGIRRLHVARWRMRSRKDSHGVVTASLPVTGIRTCRRCIRRPDGTRVGLRVRPAQPTPQLRRAAGSQRFATPRPCHDRTRTARCGAESACGGVLRPAPSTQSRRRHRADSRTRRN